MVGGGGREIPNSDETNFRLVNSLNIYGKVSFTNLDVFKSSKVKICGKGGVGVCPLIHPSYIKVLIVPKSCDSQLRPNLLNLG